MLIAFFVVVSTLLLAPVRPAPYGLRAPDAEQEWNDELRRTGRITVDVGEGARIEVVAKEMRGRELSNPTILIYGPMGLRVILHAKTAELRVTCNSLLLRLADCQFSDADGATGYVESKICQYELAPKK